MKRKIKEGTNRESEKRNAGLVSTAETSGELAQRRKMSTWQGRPSHLCQKEKSYQFRSTDNEMGESQDEQKPHLVEKEEVQSCCMGWKGSALH